MVLPFFIGVCVLLRARGLGFGLLAARRGVVSVRFTESERPSVLVSASGGGGADQVPSRRWLDRLASWGLLSLGEPR